MTEVVVDGLIMKPNQQKIALGCDECGSQFGGGYLVSDQEALLSDAEKAGWVSVDGFEDRHLCKGCVSSRA